MHRLLSEKFKDLTTLSESTGLIYHRLYFKSYVIKRNLSFAKLEEDENKNRGEGEQKKPQYSGQGTEPSSACTRSLSQSIIWTNCINCQKSPTRKTRSFITLNQEHSTNCSAKKAVLQWVFCWEN